MNSQRADIDCDLMVIGTGMAGMATAMFAAKKGIKAVQVGVAGQLGFASGLIDVLGIYPVAGGRVVENPWQAITSLGRKEPKHPYAMIQSNEIRTSVNAVLEFLGRADYPYVCQKENNMVMPTSAGTIKPTYAVPHTMAYGPAAMARKEPCLVIDFKSLKGYSSRQIAENLSRSWPGLRPVSIGFPEASTEMYSERMARSLENPRIREKLADLIAPHIGDACSVAMPALLGVFRTLEVTEDLSRALGLPVFEIPTMLPGAAGIRLKEIFEQHLPEMGITSFFQHKVRNLSRKKGGGWIFEVEGMNFSRLVSARTAIVCSGRFLGGGLHADRHGIKETIFSLPIAQAPERASWHQRDMLDPAGHRVNRSGIAVDRDFRPSDSNGRPVYPDLFAAGTILAGQDWMRQKCGSGLAIATAYAAFNACNNFLEKA